MYAGGEWLPVGCSLARATVAEHDELTAADASLRLEQRGNRLGAVAVLVVTGRTLLRVGEDTCATKDLSLAATWQVAATRSTLQVVAKGPSSITG